MDDRESKGTYRLTATLSLGLLAVLGDVEDGAAVAGSHGRVLLSLRVELVESSLSSRSGGFGGLVSMDILSAMPLGWPSETTAALRQAPQ